MMFSQDELASHFSFQYEETVRFCVCKYDTMPGGFIVIAMSQSPGYNIKNLNINVIEL